MSGDLQHTLGKQASITFKVQLQAASSLVEGFAVSSAASFLVEGLRFPVQDLVLWHFGVYYYYYYCYYYYYYYYYYYSTSGQNARLLESGCCPVLP